MPMDATRANLLRSLLRDRPVTALATLHDGLPFASMVPIALATTATGPRFVTHVSQLAAHTQDMTRSPEVCLLLVAPESAAAPQALPRVSIQAVAEFIPPEHVDHAILKAAYLARHPQAANLFQLGDFTIVMFKPLSARFVAGFGSAHTLGPETLAAIVEPGIV